MLNEVSWALDSLILIICDDWFHTLLASTVLKDLIHVRFLVVKAVTRPVQKFGIIDL